MPQQIFTAETVFLDLNGDPLTAGKVYFYESGTTIPKAVWVDSEMSVAQPNPIVLDQGGKATIWGTGIYRQVVQDQFGTQLWDLEVGSPFGGVGDGSFNNLLAEGNLEVQGQTLLVGPVGLESSLVVSGIGDFNNGVTINGTYPGTSDALAVNGSMQINGGNLTVPGVNAIDLVANGTLTVHGVAAFLDGIAVGGDLTCSAGNMTLGGSFTASGEGDFGGNVSALSFITTSRAELKTDVMDLDINALSLIRTIGAKSFKWKDKPESEVWGFLADEMGEPLSDGKGVSLVGLIVVLWKAMQELDHWLTYKVETGKL